MKKTLQKYPLYLLLLPLFLVLHVEKEHHGLIAYRFVYKEIAFLFIAPVIFYFISYWFTRSMRKAGAASFLLLLVFYFFGDVKDSLNASSPGSFWQSYGFLLSISVILLIAFIYLIRKKKSGFERLTLYLNIAILLSIGVDAVAMAFSKDNLKSTEIHTAQGNLCYDCVKPDIYYLIFDSYTSSNLLSQEFNYQNTAIDSFLTGKGFRIIRNSRSNYNLTPFSISSTFNMRYLPGVDTARKYYLKNYLPAVGEVYNNQLVPTLEKMGYEIYNHSIFNIKSHPSTIEAFDTWGTRKLYQQHNIFKKINDDIGWHFPTIQRWINGDIMTKYSINRDEHDSAAFKHILQTAALASDKPKFVYGHIFKPHSPYTYDSAGNKIAFRYYENPEEDKNAYVQQIEYVNKLMTQIVNTILSHQNKPVIMIIQGDHGYRYFDQQRKSPEFSNFNAVYYSNQDYHLLNDSLTNVNTFRVVFNTFFKQQYQLLDNEFNFIRYK